MTLKPSSKSLSCSPNLLVSHVEESEGLHQFYVAARYFQWPVICHRVCGYHKFSLSSLSLCVSRGWGSHIFPERTVVWRQDDQGTDVWPSQVWGQWALSVTLTHTHLQSSLCIVHNLLLCWILRNNDFQISHGTRLAVHVRIVCLYAWFLRYYSTFCSCRSFAIISMIAFKLSVNIIKGKIFLSGAVLLMFVVSVDNTAILHPDVCVHSQTVSL